MVKISGDHKHFSALKAATLSERKILEREHLEECIWNSPEAFCQELGQDLLIIGKEVWPSPVVDDRIDLLAMDENGFTVILELKRDSHKLQLFQAISYAGMVAGLTIEEVLGLKGIDQKRSAEIGDFLEPEAEAPNHDQRIILVAEEFDYEVLVGAQWLYEKFDVNIACVRVSLALDETTEYLAFTQIFPNPELAEIAKRRRGFRTAGGSASGPSSWDEAFSRVQNPAVVEFFKQQLAGGAENNLSTQRFFCSIGAKRRYRFRLTRNYANGKQLGRFEDDLNFWRNRLSEPDSVGLRTRAHPDDILVFRLITPNDFAAFESAVKDDLPKVIWEEQMDALPESDKTNPDNPTPQEQMK